MAKQTKQEWADISNEEYRKYVIVTSRGIAEVRIDNPKGLKVEQLPVEEGDAPEIEHLVLDSTGEVHRITHGWLKISFKMKSDG